MLWRIFLKRYLLEKSRGSVVRIIATISIFVMTVGVAAMVTVLSVMQGFDRSMQNRLVGVEPHLVLKNLSPADLASVTQIVGENGRLSPFERQDVILRTIDGNVQGAIAEGFTEQRFLEVAEKTGEKDHGSIDPRPSEIMVGADLARKMGVWEGDIITVVAPESLISSSSDIPTFQKIKVGKVFQSEVNDIDNQMIFYVTGVGLKKLSQTASLESGYEVRFLDPMSAGRFKKLIKEKTGIDSKTFEELNSTLFYALKMEKFLMGLFLALVIVVGSFSVVAVLSLLVIEKRVDMGVLKALGASRAKIRNLFLALGVCIGTVGLFSGLILGIGLSLFIKNSQFNLPNIYYDPSIPVEIEPIVVLCIGAFGFILIFLGCLLPAIRISKLRPIEVIRRG